ncbi:hypothetical protein CMQ_6250 [Grosmannia clavigera kw1407]|uniref:Small ribosomal subunit protein mS41 n=1 Tax=Grosmannia clavigera (strain kw1407 / UAMH 11150) TaxID=655863 RepID=F0XMB2_GROCL|nr:uncharacterized protein CMQ_6250 [Grosmannia clavigera kw1407]EFX01308.1 hypothetical protein CMQ_6250 [Grosmannia clavigera kw1407]
MSSLRSIRPTLGLLLTPPRWAPAATAQLVQQPARRWAHQGSAASPAASKSGSVADSRIPAPIPLVPDVATFLTVIGRNMKQHAAKFPTWEALFTLTSMQLRELGIEPPRDRRYLLRWCQRFREGRFGICGDFAHVRDGVAELRVREQVDEADPLQLHKTVVNVDIPAPTAPEAEAEAAEAAEAGEGEAGQTAASPPTSSSLAEAIRVHGYKVVGARTIAGPFALPLKAGSGARVLVTEGMWEDKRGRKIDGGERRRAEVRFKRQAAERKALRE